MRERFAHYKDPPLNTDRDTLLWAVAHATHFSWSACNTYGMSQLMMRNAPTLCGADRALFHFLHTSNALVGVPLWRLPQDFRELIGPVTRKLLLGKMTLAAARADAARILGYHGHLKDQEKRQDREYRKSVAERVRRHVAARDLRGRVRKSRRKKQ